MLRKLRISVSIILFTLITLYFLDFREMLPQSFHFLADIQFVSALLSLNLIIIVSLLLLTLVFGRIYCSSICPMGIYQDIVAWLSKKQNRRKRYSYSSAKTILRWGTLLLVSVAFIFGFTFLLGLLDPYGAYGRIVTHLFRPIYLAGNNLLETIFTQFNNYTFFRVGIYTLSVFSTVVSLFTLVGVGLLAWRNGRTFCNTLCPVGTILGFISRFSLLKVQFDSVKCNSCGLCAMKCKASCIDSKNLIIDYSRCINCFNCVEACNRDAMQYKPIWSKKKKVEEEIKVDSNVNQSKRRFLSATVATGVAATSLLAQATTSILSKRELKRQQPIAPPGVQNIDRLLQKCISCHLCVTKCPSHVIKPALFEYGLGGIMQPKLYFDHGFCSYDCTVCGDVCPTGAILPLTKEEKHHTQMGQVNFILENCIVYYDETSCGACSEHCPTQAVSMVPYKGSLTIPHIEPSICVGCGGCEYVCPAIPFKAIYVEGLKEQQTIELEHEEQVDHIIDDFGF